MKTIPYLFLPTWGVHEVLEQRLQSELISTDSGKGKHSTLPLGTLNVGKPKSQIKSNRVELITLKRERFFSAYVIAPHSLHFIWWTSYFFYREQRVDWEIQCYFEMASNLPEGNSFTSNLLSQWSLKMETEDWDPAGISSFPPFRFPSFHHCTLLYASLHPVLHGRSLEERMDLKLMFQAKGTFLWYDYLLS